jgi:hypothetical protein
VHADLGVNVGQLRLTYTTWYASGDDNPHDGTKHNFMSTDVDMNDSLYKNTEVKLNFGYLFSDDGMNNFVGGPDKGNDAPNIYRTTKWIRYMF